MSGAELASLLDRHGFDFFTGVPCSLVEDLLVALEHRPGAPWIPSVREDVAVGLAAGAWLGGRRPVVVMQNSGLGTSMNALVSLSLMYGLPALLVVTWRGFEGKDAPEHILMGEISPALLDLLGIPHRVLGHDTADESLAWARREMDAREIPVALLVPPGVVATPPGVVATPPGVVARPKGVVATGARAGGSAIHASAPDATIAAASDGELRPVISRREALAVAVKELGDAPAIHANGYISRDAFAIDDRTRNFYMLGSMGLASAIGLGLAVARPADASVVVDGDGNLLMSLGTLAMVGSLGPRNFIHLVLDNEVYASTGGQRSPSRDVRLDRLARSAGYRTAVAATSPDQIAAALRAALDDAGPHFILVKVTTTETPGPRISHTPRAIRDRFRRT